MTASQLKPKDSASDRKTDMQQRSDAMQTYKIASIPADGCKPDVIAAGLQA